MPYHPMSGPRRGSTSPSTPKTVPANSPPLATAAPVTTNPQPAPPPPPQAPQLPPAQNGPIFPENPQGLSGGAVSYNPTTAPYGFDQSMPGVREQMWSKNQNMWFDTPQLDWADGLLPQFEDPWTGEGSIEGSLGDKGSDAMGQYWAGVSGSMNSPTGAEQAVSKGYNDPNLARLAFDRMGASLPGSFQPKFDAFYDRMHDKVMSDVNAQSAARGSYGSNAALNNSIGAGLDVEANRSKAHTDFMLADSENQRNWLNMYGQQGRYADLSGQGAYNANVEGAKYGLDKTKTLGELAFKADESELARDKLELEKGRTLDELKRNRLDSGISTAFGLDDHERARLEGSFREAGASQEARRVRINDALSQVGSFEKDTQDFVMDNFDALLGGDTQMSDQELQTMIAQAADQRGWDQQQQERIFRDAKTLLDMKNGSKNAAEAKTG